MDDEGLGDPEIVYSFNRLIIFLTPSFSYGSFGFWDFGLFTIYYLLFTIYYLLCIIYLLCIFYLLFIIHYPLSIYYLLFVIYSLPSTVYRLPSTIYHLLLIPILSTTSSSILQDIQPSMTTIILTLAEILKTHSKLVQDYCMISLPTTVKNIML